MACFHPLLGYRARARNPSGKYSIVFTPKEAFHDLPINIPCGQCIGCRIERTRMWAVRMMHEASLHEDNCFITLTYSDENLPPGNNLTVSHFQDFMKRLRARIQHDAAKNHTTPPTVKYYHCGEYGEHYQRPHYHACLFNFDFPDKYKYKIVNDETYYRSPLLEELWPNGMSMVGDVTFESAAYVARYITKKITGKMAHDHYTFQDPDGNEVSIVPEYATMSRRGGIGLDWYKKFKRDLYPDDFVVIKGKKVRIPKFYDSKYEAEHPDEYRKLKIKRALTGSTHAENNTHDRLLTREKILKLKAEKLKRGYEK